MRLEKPRKFCFNNLILTEVFPAGITWLGQSLFKIKSYRIKVYSNKNPGNILKIRGAVKEPPNQQVLSFKI